MKGKAMSKLRMILALVLSVVFLTSPAQAWWNKDWKYRKPIAVDTSPSGINVSGPIGRTVVLVKLTSGNFTFTEAMDNGADIRIVDSDDKTPLAFDIERYDATTGIAYLWVSVPALNGGEKKQLWLYFGNENAPAGSDAKGTFDPDYMAVYHFGENPGLPSADATANANRAQNPPAGIDDGAIIGRAARFPGQGGIQIPASPSLAMPAGAPFTLTAWVKPGQLAGDQAIFTRGPMSFGIADGVPYVAVGGASVRASAPIRQGAWSHLSLVADGEAIKLFVNGIEAGAASTALPAIDGPILVGGAEGRPFTGEIDELRLSKSARPAAMLLAMASAEGPDNKLVSVSETAEQQAHGSGVIPFIVGKLEPLDTGIVILCMMLLTAAVVLMVAKIRYLNAAQRGNRLFMKRFRDLHENLVPIREMAGVNAQEAAYLEKTPLGHLYSTGIDELMVRRQRAATRPLSGEAVEAMRAAVDAEVVAENQRLDHMMVILTIAISGGPFIGLLGTVIGVMSTFGGVAMAGDVNVNAIAPGIAAALLATIAGLAAAIPSLFGYNYINSRISSLADEMRVFVDRLVTRLAEIQADASLPPEMPMAAE